MSPRAPQIFFVSGSLFFSLLISLAADLVIGEKYSFNFTDVDGHAFSTADNHVTLVVLTTITDVAKARAVGDRVPDRCLGDPTYRMISVLTFEKKHSRPVRALLAALVRRRLDSEARGLQHRYDQLKIRGDARRDVFAVADFDGALASQPGAKPGASKLRVFVFGRDGKLLQQWSDVPSTEELDQALKPGGTTSVSSH